MRKRILLTNDDGYDAPGIEVLFETLKKQFDITLVGPLGQCSTTGHTMALDRPLRLRSYGENRYSVDGHPADCTLMGIGHIMKDNPPDLVISGINRGGNMGQDIYYSGTVAAAREASFHDYPAISVSTTCEFDKNFTRQKYQLAADYIGYLVENDVEKLIPGRTVLNINAPSIERSEHQGVKMTQLGFRRYSEGIETRSDTRSRPYYWIVGSYHGFDDSIADSDCQAVYENKISASYISLNRESERLDKAREQLSELNRNFR